MMKVEEDGARRALQFMGTVDDLSLSANPELDIPDCPVVIACPCPAVIDDPRRYFSVAVFLVVSCRLGRACRLDRTCRRFRDLSIAQRFISPCCASCPDGRSHRATSKMRTNKSRPHPRMSDAVRTFFGAATRRSPSAFDQVTRAFPPCNEFT
jgi:hypothetical protein